MKGGRLATSVIGAATLALGVLVVWLLMRLLPDVIVQPRGSVAIGGQLVAILYVVTGLSTLASFAVLPALLREGLSRRVLGAGSVVANSAGLAFWLVLNLGGFVVAASDQPVMI